MILTTKKYGIKYPSPEEDVAIIQRIKALFFSTEKSKKLNSQHVQFVTHEPQSWLWRRRGSRSPRFFIGLNTRPTTASNKPTKPRSLKVNCHPNLPNRYWMRGASDRVPRLPPDATIPVARDKCLSKYSMVTMRAIVPHKLVPIPNRRPYVRYITSKLGE